MSEGAVDTGAGDAGAAAPDGVATPEATPAATGVVPVVEATPEASWTDSLTDEDRTYVETKGWKDSSGLLKSYRNIERLRGVSADKLARIPDWDNGDEVSQFNRQMGVPDTADGYEPMTATAQNGELDVAELDAVAHSIHLNPRQREGLLQAAVEMVDGANARIAEQTAAANEAGMSELEIEWGPAAQENHVAAQRAQVRLGLNEDAFEGLKSALGEAGRERLMARIGRMMGEHKRGEEHSEPDGPFGMTPERAKERRDALSKDQAFGAKLRAKDADATKEWSDLNYIITGFRLKA